MTRCQWCDGILAKDERVCYRCGEPVPGRSKSPRSFVLLVALLAMISFIAYSLLTLRVM
jgi:hypothetical protein